jgi:DNA helicase-2/ATP-dependent DNA helicase PcrA
MRLNREQYAAVHTLQGPLLVLAGAGTGKTQVVTTRIAELIRSGIRPSRILAVTFTNKAAAEMQDRAMAMIGGRNDDRPEISTFHSLCVRILRRHIRKLGYPEAFAIYDRGDQEGIARNVLREIRVSETVLRPGDMLSIVGGWKNACVRPAQAAAVAQSDREHLAAAAYRRYQEAMKAVGAVDFDDLLLLVEELFDRHAAVRREEAARFDHVLVDEYQDTNGSQYRIVKALAQGHCNLCVVGDDDQSIYGWRGAEVTHILNFARDWPETKVVRLQTNYRSTRQIIAWANRLIAFNRLRHVKVLEATKDGPEPRIVQCQDETDEARRVVQEIAQRITIGHAQPRDIAILFRTNEQPRALEMELRRAKVPYVLIGGMSFYDRKEIRDLLSYLKVLANPRDEVSLLRIINTPPRGISKPTITRLTELAVQRSKPLWDVISAKSAEGVPPTARFALEKFTALIHRYREAADNKPVADLLNELLREIKYQDELARQYPDDEDQQARWASIEELVNAAAIYWQRTREPSLIGFLQDTMLGGFDDDKDKESKLERNAAVLMTLHAAKGLEFPEVYLVGMEEGFLPHKRSLAADNENVDEERRLCYVGVTRAKVSLTLTLALSRRKWGKTHDTIPSRFLFELTGKADSPNYRAAIAGRPPKRRGGGSRG